MCYGGKLKHECGHHNNEELVLSIECDELRRTGRPCNPLTPRHIIRKKFCQDCDPELQAAAAEQAQITAEQAGVAAQQGRRVAAEPARMAAEQARATRATHRADEALVREAQQAIAMPQADVDALLYEQDRQREEARRNRYRQR